MNQLLKPILTQHPPNELRWINKVNSMNIVLRRHSRISVYPKAMANMNKIFSPPGVQGFFVDCEQNFQTQIFAKEKKSQTWNIYLKFDSHHPKLLIKTLLAGCWPESTSSWTDRSRKVKKESKHWVRMAKKSKSFGYRINVTSKDRQYTLYADAFLSVAKNTSTKMITSSFISKEYKCKG